MVRQDNVVEAVGLTKRLGDLTAVDRASFALRPGRLVGLVGPNGAARPP